MTISPADERLQAGVDLFNQGEYFACHDVWEELWSDILGEERDFIKGLIHLTVAMHHFSEGNPGGGRKMSRSATAYLAKYPGDYLQLDVASLLADLESRGWQPVVDGERPVLRPVPANTETQTGGATE
jgi:predicted metal-dependent hydrolase